MILERGVSTRKDAPPPYVEVDDSATRAPPSPVSQFSGKSGRPELQAQPSTRSTTSESSSASSNPRSNDFLAVPNHRVHTQSSSSSVRSTASVNALAQALDSGKGKWFHTKKKTAKEVRAVALQVISELVRSYGKPRGDPDAEPPESVLANCATACESASVNFSGLVQEQIVDGHSAIYWSLVKHNNEIDRHNLSSFTSCILRHSSPLTDLSRVEIRKGCLVSSNKQLFDTIRCMEVYTGVTRDGLDEDFLPDVITVDDAPSAAFTVHFEIMKFMPRLQLANEIPLEFIAKGRIWRLTFSQKNGAWQVSLTLLESSPPTFVDATLHVLDASPFPVISSPSVERPTQSTAKPLPSITVDIKSQSQLFALDNKTSKMHEIVVPLNNPTSTNLLVEGSSYISVDETLRTRLDMQLVKPEKESRCIIC